MHSILILESGVTEPSGASPLSDPQPTPDGVGEAMAITDGQETVEPTSPTDWLVRQKLPTDETEARRTARRAKSFVIIDGEL